MYFSIDLVIQLRKNFGINEHAIKLIERKPLLYRLIYVFSLIELETLKTYIKSHLKTGFIEPFKSRVNAAIIFDKNPDSNFCLCFDYQDLKNLTIKN